MSMKQVCKFTKTMTNSPCFVGLSGMILINN